MANSGSFYPSSAEYVAARATLNDARYNYATVDSHCYVLRQAARDACAIARAAYHSNPALPGLQVAYTVARNLRDTVTASSNVTSETAFAQMVAARDAMETARVAYHTAV